MGDKSAMDVVSVERFGSETAKLDTRLFDLDLLFFSRGRGRGHAIPDLGILRQAKKIRPSLTYKFVSYATGSELLLSAGEPVIDLHMPEANTFIETLMRAARVIETSRPHLVVSHEEPAALVAAGLFHIPTVFLTHWFTSEQDLWSEALTYADSVLFMERPGLFPEPQQAGGKVKYLGPVLRRFTYGPSDRESVRTQLGLSNKDSLILILPFGYSEITDPIGDLLIEALDKISGHRKHVIWVANKDRLLISEKVGQRHGFEVIEFDWELERLMVASDLAITKATYNIGRELNILGVPSISLSRGLNFIDDLFAKTSPTNTFIWTQETDPTNLAHHMESILAKGLYPPDYAAIKELGGTSVSTMLIEKLCQPLDEN